MAAQEWVQVGFRFSANAVIPAVPCEPRSDFGQTRQMLTLLLVLRLSPRPRLLLPLLSAVVAPFVVVLRVEVRMVGLRIREKVVLLVVLSFLLPRSIAILKFLPCTLLPPAILRTR